MPTNTLTDARCKGAKPADKPYKLFDGGGLHLYVSINAYWAGRKDVSASYRSNAERGIEMHLGRLLTRPIANITREDLLGELLLLCRYKPSSY